MGRGDLPTSVADSRRMMENALHCPGNLGIQFRSLRLPNKAATPVLALFIIGLADEELIRHRILEPLERAANLGPQPAPRDLMNILPAARIQVVGSSAELIQQVLEGETALFIEGAAEALVVSTEAKASNPAGGMVSEHPTKELFGRDLLGNIALIRTRLRDPALIAEPQVLPRGRGTAAVVYLEGRADPAVLSQIRQWVKHRTGEEAMRRGLSAGLNGKIGLLPTTLTSKWPDKAATLLDAGYVAVLMDGLHLAYLAPVTSPAMLLGPLDDTLARPISVWLRGIRLLAAGLVLLAAGVVVALMNYHQEMMPTPFLLALASVRENAPLPILAEMLLLETLQELVREVGFHLPGRLAPGAALIAGKVLILIMVQSGVVDGLLGAISVAMAYVMLGLLNYDLIYLVRFWRFLIIFGAGIFGFYGIAAVTFLMAAYLTQAESFGVPFLGETGVHFTAPGRVSSSKGGMSGAKAAGR